MAHTTYSTVLTGAQNQGSQIGLNSGSVENHFHPPNERVETPPPPSLLIPFHRDPDFVDRGELVNRVLQHCTEQGSWTALVGLGGVGKSQLAIEYAYRTREQSPETWVFWVHASNVARFEQSFRDIADDVKLFGRRDPRANIFKLVHDWLRNPNRKWILILDNVDDAEFLCDTKQDRSAQPDQQEDRSSRPLREYLPRSPNGSILVTSRSREAALALVEQPIIEVGPMSPADSQALLEKKLRDQDSSEAVVELATILEFIPLAMVQAAAYIVRRAPRCSIRQYIEEFQMDDRKKSSLLNYKGGQLRRDSEAQNSIIITWQISFRHIQDIRPGAADLLSLMSFCDRQGIPETLLRHQSTQIEQRNRDNYEQQNRDEYGYDSDTDDKDSRSQCTENEEFEDSIQMLRDYYLVTALSPTMFEMHSLIQLATRKWLEANGKLERWKQQFIYNLGAVLPTGAFENWERCRVLFPHAKAAMAQRPKDRVWLIEWSSILYMAAWYATKQGNYQIAAEMAEQAMSTRSKILGVEAKMTLDSMAMLGAIYITQGRWTKAEESEMQAIKTAKTILGAKHPNTLGCMNDLAYIYRGQGRLKEAEELFTQVVIARDMVLGAEHPDTLASIANLASTFWDQGRWKEAEELQRKVIEISKRVHGAEHLSTLTYMNNLAVTYRDQGRWKEAEEIQVQVVEIIKTVLGEEHPDTLTSIANLALVFHEQGRWKEAEELEIQVMEISNKVLGAEHPDTLASISSLASTFSSQGRWKEAEELEIKVVEISKRVLGAEHLSTLNYMDNLALIFQHHGRWKEAEELVLQVIETRKRVLGVEHPHTLISMSNLALTYEHQGRWKEAEELAMQVMKTRKIILGAKHPDTLTSMNNLACIWNGQGKIVDAIKLMTECLEARTQILGADHPLTVSSSEILHRWRTDRGQ